MRADSTDSPRQVTWRRYGPRALGIVLLLLLGGCATRAPLAGLLPGVHRPHPAQRPTAPPASAPSGTTPTTPAAGAY